MSAALTEQEINTFLHYVKKGLTNVEIGHRLSIGESAVKDRMKSLLAKYGCRNRIELIDKARALGMLVDNTVTVTTEQHNNSQWFVVVGLPGETHTVASWCSKADANLISNALKGFLNSDTIVAWKGDK
jgi:DNA-binding CsgD family transcriptional regulator